MRAGPLSNSEVINTLNEKFVNTWVLLRELPELIDGAKGDGARLVATRLQQNYTDSVDMLVLSPIGDVVAHQPEMALPYRNRDKVYLSLLGRSLAAYESKHQLNSEPINLGRKLKEVSRTFRASGTNTHDMSKSTHPLLITTGYSTLRYRWVGVRRSVGLNCSIAIQT